MIKPLGSLVLVKEQKEDEKTTKSGLLISNISTVTDLKKGTIVAIGDGDRDSNGVIHPIPLSLNATVLYSESHATDVTDTDGEEYKFINWNHLFGEVLNNEQ